MFRFNTGIRVFSACYPQCHFFFGNSHLNWLNSQSRGSCVRHAFLCDWITQRSTNLPNDPANKMADEPESAEHGDEGEVEIDIESLEARWNIFLLTHQIISVVIHCNFARVISVYIFAPFCVIVHSDSKWLCRRAMQALFICKFYPCGFATQLVLLMLNWRASWACFLWQDGVEKCLSPVVCCPRNCFDFAG